MNGFFCYSEYLFPPEEHLRFLLQLSPLADDPLMTKPVYLEGIAEVIHVSVGASSAGFGLGCEVISYRVLPGADLQTIADVRAVLGSTHYAKKSAQLKDQPPFPYNRLH